jgi:hypothetical protein
MKVRFKQWNCDIEFGKYSNNRIGFRLIEGFDTIANCTINIPNENILENEVIIKDYAENEGMLNALKSAGVISEPIRFVNSGHITAPVCMLLIPIK